MKKGCCYIFLLVTLQFIGSQIAFAQYKMSNMRVSVCDGTLTDSDNGRPPNPKDNYDHNENLTFTIAVPGSKKITMTFTGNFCTETGIDILTFFDGPDTLSPQIGGKYSGSNKPGTITATSGYLTIHFVSDANISCSGWTSSWTVEPPVIVAPKITSFENPVKCGAKTANIKLDKAVPCSGIKASQFTLTGPSAPAIISAVGVNCVGDSTKTIAITFANPGISESGVYNLVYHFIFIDPCGRVHPYDLPISFTVDDCPIQVVIGANDTTICYGTCANIRAYVKGGTGRYTYTWSNNLGNKPDHTVCPTLSRYYTVTVDDDGPALPGTASIHITVLPLPDAGSPKTACNNAAAFSLIGTPSGGTWKGNGVSPPGVLYPYYSAVGKNIITYTGPNGCADTVLITILPISAGLDEASCIGAASFNLSGATPPGGTWSGTGITDQNKGTFSPSAQGTFIVTYNAPNGCSASKKVNVDSPTVEPDRSVCINTPPFLLNFNPKGGSWAGKGITNWYYGSFDPQKAGPGAHILTYSVRGCANVTVTITVQDIKGGNDTIVCPFQAAFNFNPGSPAGGTWSGTGITDANKGTFNPFANSGSDFVSLVVYTYNGCSDTLKASAIATSVTNKTYTFCPSNKPLDLDFVNTQYNPPGGTWSGPGVSATPPYQFDPKKAGPGQHSVGYSKNTCSAFIKMIVNDSAVTQNDTVVYACQSAASQAFNLKAKPGGGLWAGPGIVDSLKGTFDPVKAGDGIHKVFYTAPTGCLDSLQLTVTQLSSVTFNGLNDLYCFKDTNYVLNGTPAGGYYTIDGTIDTVKYFNPAKIGRGQHSVHYTFGSAACKLTVIDTTLILPKITPILPFKDKTICYEDELWLLNKAMGGDSTLGYKYTWNTISSKDSFFVKPTNPFNKYVVEVNDGCSSPGKDSLTINVQPEIKTTFIQGDSVCYGQKTWVKVVVNSAGNYTYNWNTKPVSTTDSINSVTGKYLVTVTNVNTGCAVVLKTKALGFNYLDAHFETNPNNTCATLINPEFTLIDLSAGAENGRWSFGDGDTMTYGITNYIQHTYADTGHYRVILTIQNHGGCTASDTADLCIKAIGRAYIPSVFTPNSDGLNDVFEPLGIGIINYDMQVYNRWGNELYHTTTGNPWDGRQLDSTFGSQMEVYIYKMTIYYVDSTFSTHTGSVVILR